MPLCLTDAGRSLRDGEWVVEGRNQLYSPLFIHYFVAQRLGTFSLWVLEKTLSIQEEFYRPAGVPASRHRGTESDSDQARVRRDLKRFSFSF